MSRARTPPALLLAAVMTLLCRSAVAAPEVQPSRLSPPALEPTAEAQLAQAAPESRQESPPPSKAQAKPRSSPARSRPVSVRVILLGEKPSRGNPEEFVEIQGVRYIYFNSPRLSAPARPLGEPKPRFPTGPLDRQDGAVVLQLLINEQGELQQSDVVCAARGFAPSALESVTGLKFRPARDKSGPVKSYMLVEFGYGRGFPCIPAPFY